MTISSKRGVSVLYLHSESLIPCGCVLAVQSNCTLCVGHSPVMDSCLRSAIPWKWMLKYLSNIGILLELEVKCAYARLRTQARTRTPVPRHQHHLISSSDRVSLWSLPFSGYATVFKGNNWKEFGLLNHTHFKDKCWYDVWSRSVALALESMASICDHNIRRMLNFLVRCQ